MRSPAIGTTAQLWQSGDDVDQVINRGNRTASYELVVRID
jgi:hypothetical protein